LLEHNPNSLGELNTAHLALVHKADEINELNSLLNQIANAKFVTTKKISGTLDLIADPINYHSNYRFHPRNLDFGIDNSAILLIKRGKSSNELNTVETTISQEIHNHYDTIPDAVHNELGLQFWDYSYSPFIAIFAPFDIRIDRVRIDQNISINVICSPLVDPDHLRVMVVFRNDIGQQIGKAHSLTGFTMIRDNNTSLIGDVQIDSRSSNIVIHLFYYEELIEEAYFRRDRDTDAQKKV
jgi:hypothetical protein